MLRAFKRGRSAKLYFMELSTLTDQIFMKKGYTYFKKNPVKFASIK
jgi:hypothetical protein